eukprot:3548685-Ditylum_brightwellii.AAC.1
MARFTGVVRRAHGETKESMPASSKGELDGQGILTEYFGDLVDALICGISWDLGDHWDREDS